MLATRGTEGHVMLGTQKMCEYGNKVACRDEMSVGTGTGSERDQMMLCAHMHACIQMPAGKHRVRSVAE